MGTDRLIYIRCDGNSHLATGHLMRCLSVAHALRSLSDTARILFLVSDKESYRLLSALFEQELCSFPIRILASADYQAPEAELQELIGLCTGSAGSDPASLPVLLVDSYFVTETYLLTLRKYARLVYIDDLQLFDYPVDLLINYDVIPSSRMPVYEAAYQKAGKRMLGCLYAPLRPRFFNETAPLREQVGRILITSGGSDPYHFCTGFLSFLQEQDSLPASQPLPSFEIVAGNLNQDKELLRTLAFRHPYFHLHENVRDMDVLMRECDLAVSAGGTTLYELCAVGVPAISYSFADNQLSSTGAFAEEGLIPYAGDLRTGFSSVLENIFLFMTDMSCSKEKRSSAQKKMCRAVNGNGSREIADAILKL